MIQTVPKTYRFYWKYYTKIFFKSVEVLEHNYNKKDKSMTLLLKNRSQQNIAEWVDYECKLGVDWFNKIKGDIVEEIKG